MEQGMERITKSIQLDKKFKFRILLFLFLQISMQ